MAKKVALIIAHQGYQHIEYGEAKKILEKAGFAVVTVSDKLGTATGKDNSTTKVDNLISDLNVKDYAGIFFIGGPGALEHLDNQVSYKLLQTARASHIPIGAICISTRILAKAGVLDGKEATGWNDDKELPGIYRDYHVSYVPTDVVVCDAIITATGPATASQFASEIVTLLTNPSY